MKCWRAISVASRSCPAKTVTMRSGRTLWRIEARKPGRILPAAHPQTEFTITISVPFWRIASSISVAVRTSATPADVNSWRMGTIIISGYIAFPPLQSLIDFNRPELAALRWLLAISSWLLAFGFWLLAFGFWLLAFSSWLLAFGS